MAESKTFSSAIDAIVQRSRRLDRLLDIVSFARQSMRETQVLNFFERDFIEDQLTATSDPYIWAWPTNFRQMRAVQYPGYTDDRGEAISPKFKMPGRQQRVEDHYYYASGESFIFAGLGGSQSVTQLINIGYYGYMPILPYYSDAALRPATYDDETDVWTYLTAVTEEDQELAQAAVTNWLLKDWWELVVEGTLAKLYKTYGDDRASTSFGLYKLYQKSVIQGEGSASMAPQN